MIKSLIQISALLIAFQSGLIGQVVINEYSASNLDSLDSYGKSEDFIELYNAGSASVDISGYHLSDKSSKPTKWRIPDGTIMNPGSFLTFYCSGRDRVYYGEHHTNFKISQTKGNEYVLLSNQNGEIIEEHLYELTLMGHSHCRSVNGGNEWKICSTLTPGASNLTSGNFSSYTAEPTIELGAGFYDSPQSVSIQNNDPSSTLRYTTDGSTPTNSSPEYTGAISISNTAVVKARAFSNDNEVRPGKIAFATYFINESFTLPVFSIAADEVINLANGQGDLIPIGSLEYFEENVLTATAYGSLNRHGQDSWALDHRSIDWITRDEMGYSRTVKAKLFSYSDRDDHQRLMFRASGDDNYPARQNGFLGDNHFGSTHLRDEYVHTLALEGDMKLDVRAVERVIVFLNGEYWGVYGLRERPVDHDYTEEYYDQSKHNLQYLATWGHTTTEYGGKAALYDWLKLKNFIMDNDMGDPDNYQEVRDQLQVQSLIDYMIANLNSVAADWLNYNTGWWRGLDPEGDHKKWGYILWDNDATFDYYINYSYVPDVSYNAKPCDLDQMAPQLGDFFGQDYPHNLPSSCTSSNSSNSPDVEDPIYHYIVNEYDFCCSSSWSSACQEKYDSISIYGTNISEKFQTWGDIGYHERIFLKLLEESDEFKQLYYSRQADLMSTVYTCDNMLNTLDRMVAKIAPEMPRQIAKWGGNMTEWETNVATLREFISKRCLLLDDGMRNCYDVTGPYQLTLETRPAGVGEIDINTLDIREMPWTGRYFGNMDNKIKARAFDDDTYVFSHWESNVGDVIADPMAFRTTIRLTQNGILTAVFTDIVNTKELESGHSLKVYPNPAKDYIVLNYDLAKAADIKVNLYNNVGQKVIELPSLSGRKAAGQHLERINLSELQVKSGMHFIEIIADQEVASFKVMVVK